MLEIEKKIQDFDLLDCLQKRQFLVVDSRRKNGVIIYKRHHAEFAGPGSMIGGVIDVDLAKVITVGEFSVTIPETAKERIAAYLMRRRWNRVIKQITEQPNSLERAQLIVDQFEHWFNTQTMQAIPDEAFALLVGVFPETIRNIRCLSTHSVNHSV